MSYFLPPGGIDVFQFDWAGPAPGPFLQAGDSIASYTVTVRGGLVRLSDALQAAKVQARVQAPVTLPEGTLCAIDCEIVTTAGRRWTDTIEVSIL